MAYKGPAFGANTAQQKRLSIPVTDEEQQVVNESHISTSRSVGSRKLQRHNTETIGDILAHPFRPFQTKKVDDQNIKDIGEKQKDEENNTNDEVIVRMTLHFRHLVGKQDFVFKDEDIEKLQTPLHLTEPEIARFKKFNDTDDLIDFLEETKRNYSVKVHKTVDLKRGLSDSLDDSSSDEEVEESKKLEVPENKPLAKEPTTYPHKNHSEDDIVIDLNENVYVQVQFIAIKKKEHEATRKVIFAVPDPDLSDDFGQESSATWIELFGDVFYVGWLSTFTHSHHIAGVQDIGNYALWFVVMWWTWCSSALYSSRYDRGDVAHHIYKMIELVGLVIMAGGSVDFRTNPRNFIIGYIIMKGVLLLEYSLIFIVSLGAHFHSSRKPFAIYVSACVISILMWGLSFKYQSVEQERSRFVLWYLSIFIELMAHVLLQKNSRVSLAASHLGERFGLFTLIILGENCMGFINMATEAQLTPTVIAANSFGVVIIFCYFFMYFDDFSEEFNAETHLTQIWMYLHFPLHLFQVAFGIAMTDLISIHSMGWDDPTTGGFLKLEACPEVSEGATTETSTETHNTTATEQVTHTLFTAINAVAAHGEEAESVFCEIKDPNFVIKAFWITGGLILCVNSFIKLINTPIKRTSFKAFIICSSRIINAVVFFGLSAVTFGQLNGLTMTAIMMACLLFQSAVDLLD
ncbi:hypothetical protein K501DRAFT_326161 [Backusella circina FSU 941]|nr:hypothetical protein K501DRAFT_326161 [Backusella circina FSU 941]